MAQRKATLLIWALAVWNEDIRGAIDGLPFNSLLLTIIFSNLSCGFSVQLVTIQPQEQSTPVSWLVNYRLYLAVMQLGTADRNLHIRTDEMNGVVLSSLSNINTVQHGTLNILLILQATVLHAPDVNSYIGTTSCEAIISKAILHSFAT